MPLDERPRRVVGVPRALAEVAEDVLVLDVRLVGAGSEHADFLGEGRGARGK